MRRSGYTALDLSTSTLGELRAAVEALSEWPDDAEVRVRTRATWDARGGKLTRVVVGTAGTTGKAST